MFLQELHSNPHFYSAKAKRLDLCQGLVGKSAQPLRHTAGTSQPNPDKAELGGEEGD